MLTIEYFSHLPAFSMSGHAKEAPRGADIVCAGASALLYTLIKYLDKLEDEFEPEVFEYNGRINICLDPPVSLMHDARLLFEAFATGFEMLSKDYPNNVKYIKDPPFSHCEKRNDKAIRTLKKENIIWMKLLKKP